MLILLKNRNVLTPTKNANNLLESAIRYPHETNPNLLPIKSIHRTDAYARQIKAANIGPIILLLLIHVPEPYIFTYAATKYKTIYHTGSLKIPSQKKNVDVPEYNANNIQISIKSSALFNVLIN